jgi:hypothetical protein
MARFGLVHHKDDCSRQLARRWRAVLQRLWHQASDEDSTAEKPPTGELAPFIADANVDTLYVSLFAYALPAALIERGARFKAEAQQVDASVETPWQVFDAPLSMWKAGVGTSQINRGVSWSFLLRNAFVMLRLRRVPLQGLISSVRLSAECLWTYGSHVALDGVRDALAAMWAGGWDGTVEAAAQEVAAVRWQLSQIHLCVDVANWAPQPADLDRVLTCSRKRTVHVPSRADEQLAAFATLADGCDELDAFLLGTSEEWSELLAATGADDVTDDLDDLAGGGLNGIEVGEETPRG